MFRTERRLQAGKVKTREGDQAARGPRILGIRGGGRLGWVPVAAACFNTGFLDVMISLVEANIRSRVEYVYPVSCRRGLHGRRYTS